MRMKKIMLMLALSSTVVAGSANAALKDQGHGKVTFKGSIIDAPCSIAPESIDQTVDMGQVANKILQNGGKSAPRPFYIKLENCDVSSLENKTVTATFTGMQATQNKDHLAIFGTASGASIGLTVFTADGQKDIKLGEPSAALQVIDNESTMNFSAYLQGNNGTKEKPSVIVPGDFTSVANFTLAYQ
ncbi:fimbria A protein [Erwinia sp. OLTSP20]|uniref:fimbrial protein n=1 Tax=unclassified Erwinia TaxID=2622719 RepID=UPI000C17777B|nr:MULTISPECIES: fimbrial protein [unclassified Erwinia]PIJ48553.1 fimbria A protein [Erwinia sp. OAMSP11]PIJ68284.1 fimbria A protein [Erwinia sp. OLSSP12]PIJ78806.1 fimbria A protein [Erwinia sp. OLCASP19]PIJ79965.1 fimbria A protein [Erwinia sp. OLMTSP26]PIJ80650.1 fimbria A protein [Erwinia sp. OLMDSP33]